MADLYTVLGVDPTATKAEITRAYRKAVKTEHPDAGGSPDRFQALTVAHDVLKDDKRRALYDQTGSTDSMDAAIRQAAFDALVAVVAQVASMGIERFNLTAEAAALLRTQLENIAIAERNTRRALPLLLAAKTRFRAKKGADVITGILETAADSAAKNYRLQREIVTAAIALLDAHTFDRDTPTRIDQAGLQSIIGRLG